MEEVKSRGPYIYSVLESAQAFLSQHPFEELEEPTSESKGLRSFAFLILLWPLWGWTGALERGGWCDTQLLCLLL